MRDKNRKEMEIDLEVVISRSMLRYWGRDRICSENDFVAQNIVKFLLNKGNIEKLIKIRNRRGA